MDNCPFFFIIIIIKKSPLKKATVDPLFFLQIIPSTTQFRSLPMYILVNFSRSFKRSNLAIPTARFKM
jgi:hypothetical protein